RPRGGRPRAVRELRPRGEGRGHSRPGLVDLRPPRRRPERRRRVAGVGGAEGHPAAAAGGGGRRRRRRGGPGHVGGRARAGRQGATALHRFSTRPWGVGVDHGLQPTTDRMRVTRASRNVVQEIDGRPAFDVYKDYAARRGVELSAATAGPFLIGNELGIYVFDEIKKARAPLSVGTDGSLTCAAEIPEGAYVSILDGQPARMV